MGGYIIQPLADDPNSSFVTYISSFDLKGSLPSKVVQMISTKQPLSLDSLRKFLLIHPEYLNKPVVDQYNNNNTNNHNTTINNTNDSPLSSSSVFTNLVPFSLASPPSSVTLNSQQVDLFKKVDLVDSNNSISISNNGSNSSNTNTNSNTNSSSSSNSKSLSSSPANSTYPVDLNYVNGVAIIQNNHSNNTNNNHEGGENTTNSNSTTNNINSNSVVSPPETPSRINKRRSSEYKYIANPRI